MIALLLAARQTHRRHCCKMSFGTAALLAVAVASPFAETGYQFSVCSKGGGAQGVDFRSHFSVYGAQHRLQGWVRNACNDCVYGEFSGKVGTRG